MILGHAHPEVLAAVARAAPQGSLLRRPHRARDHHGRQGLRAGPEHGHGAHGQLRHRGHHERPAPGARLHRPRQDREVRGLLPRPRRLAAGQGRLRRPDPRRAQLPRRPRGPGRTDHHPALQRPRAGPRDLRRHRPRDRLHHRRAGRRQHELHPAGARLPGGSARGLRPVRRRCSSSTRS